MKNQSIRYLNQSDLLSLGADHSDAFIAAVSEGLQIHSQKSFEQPLKPYLRWSGADHIADRIIAMPCYLGGEDPIAGIKWVGSRQHNPSKFNLPRASAVIVLNDADTNYPVAFMEGSLISAMRTAAITGIATKYLARKNSSDVSVIGCGEIAFYQIKTLLEQFSHLTRIHLFDQHSEAQRAIEARLQPLFPDIVFEHHKDAKSAVKQADILVTCTVSDAPYISFDWLKKGCFISNISIMDIKPDVFLGADKVIVDDWEQSNREKKVIHQLVEKGMFSKEQLHAELGEIITHKKVGRENDEEIILLNPMGMAIDDIVCARWFYQVAMQANLGIELPLI